MSSEAEQSTEAAQRELRFPDGIPGFPGCERFALVEFAEESAFQLLQSLDDPAVAFIVAVPWLFFPDYELELSGDDEAELELTGPDEAAVFCPVTLDAEGETVYLNLLAPFVVNERTRVGRQVVLADSDQPVRAPVPMG